jgi:dsRNA-specific ribonuclease
MVWTWTIASRSVLRVQGPHAQSTVVPRLFSNSIVRRERSVSAGLCSSLLSWNTPRLRTIQCNRAPATTVSRGCLFSSLARWKQAIETLPPEKVLIPQDENERTVQAFLGDKLLGSAAASILVKNSDAGTAGSSAATTNDTGELTKLISGAVSNSLMAANVHHILPQLGIHKEEGMDVQQSSYSDWELGTMVEAAVATVHSHDPKAVVDLAEFLMKQAKKMTDPNCKGRILELGGTLTSTRIGGSDHAPVWTATASLSAHDNSSHEAQAIGSSKKSAEMRAAANVLNVLPEHSSLIPYEQRDLMTIPTPATYNQWKSMKIDSFKRDANESWASWWRRGAFDPKRAFHRAMAAPLVYSDTIVAVDSWTRRIKGNGDDDSEAAAVLMVIVSKEQRDVRSGTKTTVVHHECLPVHTASSANQARRKLGVEANEWITKLVKSMTHAPPSSSAVKAAVLRDTMKPRFKKTRRRCPIKTKARVPVVAKRRSVTKKPRKKRRETQSNMSRNNKWYCACLRPSCCLRSR